jgi:tetratricopeptide (TPR) repeat protein
MVLETQQWKVMPITEGSHDTELLATGISAVHLGDLDTARKASERLAAKAAEMDSDDRSYYAESAKPVEIMHRSVAGLIAIADGDTDKGLAMLAEGVEIAESMPPPHGAPDPLKPIHELYGEQLLAAERPDEARALFTASLLRTPNRPLSLLGLARAYAALGNEDAARKQYQKLADVWKDRDFPVLEEANRYLASADDAD